MRLRTRASLTCSSIRRRPSEAQDGYSDEQWSETGPRGWIRNRCTRFYGPVRFVRGPALVPRVVDCLSAYRRVAGSPKGADKERAPPCRLGWKHLRCDWQLCLRAQLLGRTVAAGRGSALCCGEGDAPPGALAMTTVLLASYIALLAVEILLFSLGLLVYQRMLGIGV